MLLTNYGLNKTLFFFFDKIIFDLDNQTWYPGLEYTLNPEVNFKHATYIFQVN